MREEIKYFVFVFVLGLTLLAYAHANFASKDVISIIFDDVHYMRVRIDELHKKVDKK